MRTVLARFRIKPGKEDLAREWMGFLADHLDEGNATLPDEGAHVETWFLNEEPDGLWSYVYTIVDDPDAQQERFQHSEHAIDAKHAEYMRQCVDYHTFTELTPAVALGDYSVFES
ncbi:DUF6176 family protein [Bifidobacterium vespertilionis]|uniref:Antibiotic biosynthesis monooxygenase n=1 Tax=Bifidobacterium vespertilionis TaxID=2562524 RepID=A0A5J5DYQ2_9BIFI|nr:DUF6176 family protein [Bifidobacterium vespertilionis]KAA8821955.1 hypothetical protein EMO90_01725 [Bifidobacterium vespertilionis]KAA8823254.1 hypothetical protein EM848_06065 [Bifidobacterium vespertilionis]